MEVPELSKEIRQALKEAAIQGDRSKEDVLAVAKLARGLPTDTVDKAFAEALSSTSDPQKGIDFYQDMLIAAEQFVDRAGPDRFSTASRLAVYRLITDREKPESADPSDRALVRARYIALGRAVGVPITVEILDREAELQKQHPMLWLDLASRELSTSAFLGKLENLLRHGIFDPAALIPRLKSYVQYHGVAAGQVMLDIACRKLYRERLYGEAEALIGRANLVLNKGWRLPFGGTPVFLPFPVSNVDDCIQAFQGALRKTLDEPVKIVRAFREMLDPVLTISVQDDEEMHRGALRTRVFDFLPALPAFEMIRLTGILPALRIEDGSGSDWWQDYGPWREDLPTPGRRRSAKTFDVHEVIDEWNSVVLPVEDDVLFDAGASFRSMKAADELGFGQRRYG